MRTKLLHGKDRGWSRAAVFIANDEPSLPPWIGIVREAGEKFRAVSALQLDPTDIGEFDSLRQAHDALVLYAHNALVRRGHLNIPMPSRHRPEPRDAMSHDATVML